jgi:hypothetical protein
MCWQQIGCMSRRSNKQESCGETNCDVIENKLLEDSGDERVQIIRTD